MDLQQAKINLYKELLGLNPEQMTDTEVEIMFQLSMDKDVKMKISGEISRSYRTKPI